MHFGKLSDSIFGFFWGHPTQKNQDIAEKVRVESIELFLHNGIGSGQEILWHIG